MSESLPIGLMTFELGQFLRRTVWQPLYRVTEIFHLLPPAAAVILLLLLFDVGQLREIYLSYLEDLSIVRILWALVGFALISAVFYESHYWLSTMRINVIYSNLAYPNAGANLRKLQRVAAFAWSLFPWAGLAAGLFVTRSYLVQTSAHLATTSAPSNEVAGLITLPAANTWAILASIVLLALVVGALYDLHRKNDMVQSVIIILTPCAAAAVFLLVTGSGPGQSPVLAAAILVAITAAFYGVHHWLKARRNIWIYSNFWHADTGINPRRRQRYVTISWALGPWILIALYFTTDFLDRKQFGLAHPRLASALQTLPAVGGWPIIAVAIIGVVSIGLLVALTMDSCRQNLVMRRAVEVAIVLPIIVAAMIPVLGFDMIQAFRTVGPLGSLALAYIFIFSSFALLAVLSQKSRFPALTLALAAVALSVLFHISIETLGKWLAAACVVFVVMALISRLWSVALVAALLAVLAFCTVLREHRHFEETTQSTSAAAVPNLEDQFNAWIAKRADLAAFSSDPQKPYPVFIISVEGGGIYAAVAASLFLAKLQDDCPGFAQHVFAISAVSGGAIGAAVFQALSQFAPPSPAANCQPRVVAGPQAQKVSAIMLEDHFSPVVASIVPDFLGELMGRAEALQQSFEEFNDPDDVAGRLKAKFLDHWSVGGAAPGLVLNSTWAEMGYRVAFAPFTLSSSKGSDGTLYSFADAEMPGEQNIPLMNAAVVSARFPGILPPYSVKMPDGHRWSFVDGGYSDSSGAATALALFNALKPASCKLSNVDLKVILLTSADPRPNFKDINGSDFGDTMAPIDAITKVRELLGNQAVTRASDYFEKPVLCDNQKFKTNWQIQQIKLQDQEYFLPLGWKISQATFKLISLLIGRPERCEKATLQEAPGVSDDQDNGDQQVHETTLQNNRCVMQLIEAALSAK